MHLRHLAPVLAILVIAGCGREPATEAGTTVAPTTSQPTTAKPAATPSKPRQAKPDEPKPLPAESEFVQMKRELAISGEQAQRFDAAVTKRDATVDGWFNGPEGKRLEEAKSERKDATDEARKAALDAELKKLNHQSWAVRAEGRRSVLAELTPQQRQTWAANRLTDRLLRTYGKSGLDEAQQGRVRAIATEETAKNVTPEAVLKDPYLTDALTPARVAAEARVEAEVMNDAQRAALAERRAKRKADAETKAAAAPSAAPAGQPAKP